MATCVVSGTLSSLATGETVRWRYVTPQQLADNTLLAAADWSSTTTASGVFSFTAQQKATIRVVCDAARLDFTFDVPAKSTYDIAEEL
jgi:hypothetical protein